MKLYHILLAGLLVALFIAAPVAADDPAVGTWKVDGTMLIFPCASGSMTIDANGSGTATGSANLLFIPIYSMNEEKFFWEKIGVNKYQLTFPYAVVNLDYHPAEDKFTTTVSPSQFGVPVPFDVNGVAKRV